MSQITITLLTSGQSIRAAGITAVATASVSPTAGRTVLIAVGNGRSGTGTAQTPTATGNGITYSNITNAAQASSTTRNVSSLAGLTGASPSASVITIDFGASGQSYVQWSISEVQGGDVSTLSAAIVQSCDTRGVLSASSTTLNFANAFANAENATWVAWGAQAADVMVADSRFTFLSQNSSAAPAGLSGSMWTKVNAQSLISMYANSNITQRFFGVGLELAIASGYVASPYYSGYYYPRVASV